MSKFEKNYIGAGRQVENLDIVKVTLSMKDLKPFINTYKGKKYLTFEVARRQNPDKYGKTHAAYVSRKIEPPVAGEPAASLRAPICEIKAVYNPRLKASERMKISSSADAHKYLSEIWQDMDYFESFYILLLNRANKVLGHNLVSIGGISATIADPRKIFQTALVTNASGIIIAHNHPSGQLKPSDNDIQLVKKVRECGKILDIPLLDSLILTSESYYSWADEGLL